MHSLKHLDVPATARNALAFIEVDPVAWIDSTFRLGNRSFHTLTMPFQLLRPEIITRAAAIMALQVPIQKLIAAFIDLTAPFKKQQASIQVLKAAIMALKDEIMAGQHAI